MNISRAAVSLPMYSDTGFSAKKKTDISKIAENFSQQSKAAKTEEEIQADELREQMQQLKISSKVATIDAKLKGGSELSSAELNFLKENNPELYTKAMQIKTERSLYKDSLETCTTKDDAQMMHLQKISSLSDEQKRISGNPNISDGKKKEMLDQITRREAAISDEYLKFTSSKKYKDLPTRQELLSGKAKKKTVSGKTLSVNSIYVSLKSADKGELLSAYKKTKTIDKKA